MEKQAENRYMDRKTDGQMYQPIDKQMHQWLDKWPKNIMHLVSNGKDITFLFLQKCPSKSYLQNLGHIYQASVC